MRIRHFVSGSRCAAALGFTLTMLGGLSAPFAPEAEAQGAPVLVLSAFAAAPAAASTAPIAAVELSPTPPNDTQAVAPNIVVTFDDSGSMASNYMGDLRPFDDGGWTGQWRCAGVIDPRVTDTNNILASAMNGVYYNPNVLYTPPVRADGTVFPQADSALKVVPQDGIGVNRPYNQKTLDASGGYNDNPGGSFDTTAATDLTGTKQTLTPGTGWYWNGVGTYTTYANWVYGTYPSGSGWYSTNAKGTRPSKTNELTNGAYPTTNLGDKRWKCGYDSTSPMDSSKKGPDGNAYPDGGPYYYRLKSGTTIAVDGYGRPTTGTGGGQKTLYTAANWEAVAVTNTNVTINGVTVNQWQNFANWYAYYRTRNLMTRTALSRVFGGLGSSTPAGGYGNAFRVAWQNLYTSGTFNLQDSTIITSLLDLNSPACNAGSTNPSAVSLQTTTPFRTSPNCYRSAFFNWIFGVNATSDTPARASAIRAGKFFQRGYNSATKVGNTGASGDLHDPYWDPPQKAGADGSELVCRQNFHMLVTDGYWNESNPALPAGFADAQTALTLPDGTRYGVTAAESRVFWDVQGTKLTSSQANIAFNYWATNLRPDLYDPTNGKIVPPYMPDTTTGVVTGATSAALEKYFNPNNDPANWPHMVEYMVTLGVPGKLTYSSDVDCTKSSSNDICALRRGQTNSTNKTGWTTPANNAAEGIDDTWHAAINSRGAYFNAGNPQNLVDQLSSILTNISARSAPATTGAVNTSVLVPGALGFSTGYSSADWTGTLQAVAVDTDGTTGTAAAWDAGAILDDASKTPPATRSIFTAKAAADGSFAGGVEFKTFTALDAAGQTLLSGSPASVDSGSNDTGQTRVDYLRGDRSKEGTTFRQRSHLLGAIVGSQALYVTYPSSGYRNTWPAGSPEQAAVDADNAACGSSVPSSCHSYEYFVKDHLARKPAVYVGANDGMLHAFDASLYEDTSMSPSVIRPAAGAGKELFAYVPRSVYANLGNLTTRSNFKFMPTVDGAPVSRDVFFSTDTTAPVATSKGWHTILVGGLRLGGRGVYALDITDPAAMGAGKVLWEFNADLPAVAGGKPSNLGYTYGQPNIGRLNNGKWAVLIPGGYFPDCSKAPFTAANCATPAAAANAFSSLFVVDAQTGKLIREIKTSDSTASGTVVSHGLATPVLGDYNDDQIDDVAFAGDLDGNLWRFDLNDANPSNWAVTLAYQPGTALAGKQPITSMPRLFGDPATNKFMVVFGTGKYLGASDNTSGSSATQAVYGIRDMGSIATPSGLVQQTLSEKTAADGKTVARGLTNYPVGTDKQGWYFNLGPSTSSAGERVVVTPGALFDTGRVVIQTLIPGTNDPCDASIQGAIMVVNAATGGSSGGLSGPAVAGWDGTGAGDTSVVGGRVNNPRTTGSVPLVTTIGGGTVLIPGLKLSGSGSVLNINDAVWRRRSWRELNND
ncbi:PilC/PilY family type IV pilus protein [Rhodanobacter sp. B04]|uniref:pilus assembly protein n=1 Tax=Rhodanobacter sp. B04 TaxID=1945860 RepID=UPI0009861764|nr:PilC/PilY family type IV pilus protein [Rhodanobacter sp. B04]